MSCGQNLLDSSLLLGLVGSSSLSLHLLDLLLKLFDLLVLLRHFSSALDIFVLLDFLNRLRLRLRDSIDVLVGQIHVLDVLLHFLLQVENLLSVREVDTDNLVDVAEQLSHIDNHVVC